MNDDWGKAVNRSLARAAGTVGVITGLLTIGVWGFGAFAFGMTGGLWLALGTFGVAGALEVAFRQTHAAVRERGVRPKVDETLFCILDIHPHWHVKVLQEFEHRGIFFCTWGFQEAPIPIAISPPLCPVCKKKLLCDPVVLFPLR